MADWGHREELGILGRRGTWPVACGGTTDRRRGAEGVPPRSSGRRGRREEKCNFCCTRTRLISPAVSREPIPWVFDFEDIGIGCRIRGASESRARPTKKMVQGGIASICTSRGGTCALHGHCPGVRTTTWKRKRRGGKRVSWPVVRGSWFAVRGSWWYAVPCLWFVVPACAGEGPSVRERDRGVSVRPCSATTRVKARSKLPIAESQHKPDGWMDGTRQKRKEPVSDDVLKTQHPVVFTVQRPRPGDSGRNRKN